MDGLRWLKDTASRVFVPSRNRKHAPPQQSGRVKFQATRDQVLSGRVDKPRTARMSTPLRVKRAARRLQGLSMDTSPIVSRASSVVSSVGTRATPDIVIDGDDDAEVNHSILANVREATSPARAKTKPEQRIVADATDIINLEERRRYEVESADYTGWTEDEKTLFREISLRGFEPLMPAHWIMDFKTLPRRLFTEDDDDLMVSSVCGNDFRATRALRELVKVGVLARSRLASETDPAPLIGRAIDRYIDWAKKDGRLDKDSSSLDILTLAYPSARKIRAKDTLQQSEWLEQQLRKRFRDVAARWQDVLNTAGPGQAPRYERPPPTLYGIVVCHALVMIVTYDAAAVDPDKPVLKTEPLSDAEDPEDDEYHRLPANIGDLDDGAPCNGIGNGNLENGHLSSPDSGSENDRQSMPTSPVSSSRPTPTIHREAPPPLDSYTSSHLQDQLQRTTTTILQNGLSPLTEHDNPKPKQPTLRVVANLTYQQPGYDMWNALAIAICVCMARDYCVDLAKAEGGDGGKGARKKGYKVVRVEVDEDT